MKTAHSSPPSTKQKDPQPASPDPVEEQAAHLAKQKGKSDVTNKDRENAYHEMNKTAPHQSGDESASH